MKMNVMMRQVWSLCFASSQKPLLGVEELDSELAMPSPSMPTAKALMTPTLSKLTTTKQR